MALRGPLESGDLDSLRVYFSSEDVGAWKDFNSAGYLLANAFRTTSNTAPDNLPSVKVSQPFVVLCVATRSHFPPNLFSQYVIQKWKGIVLTKHNSHVQLW